MQWSLFFGANPTLCSQEYAAKMVAYYANSEINPWCSLPSVFSDAGWKCGAPATPTVTPLPSSASSTQTATGAPPAASSSQTPTPPPSQTASVTSNLTRTESPTFHPVPARNGNTPSKMPVAELAGIAVGSAVALGLLIGGAVWWFKCHAVTAAAHVEMLESLKYTPLNT
jgi:hypothetical protein